MILLLLISLPIFSAALAMAMGSRARNVALLTAMTCLVLSLSLTAHTQGEALHWSRNWIPMLGAQFSLVGDGLSVMLCILTGLVMSLIFLFSGNSQNLPPRYYALLLLSQAGVTGVFLALDGLLFYFFWELALIPVYFLCSGWGGDKRVKSTIKFFIYTFVGSLMMLAALIFLSTHFAGGDAFSWRHLVLAGQSLPQGVQIWVFAMIFVAFAIKLPLFPFHSWQPDTYEQSSPEVTIFLSALMAKMGVFGILRWLIPMLPAGVDFWSDWVVSLAVAGIVYASLMALAQKDLKRMIAFASMAHMGLMVAASFSGTESGIHGLMIQMFHHGVSITGLWIIAAILEHRWGTRDMNQMGGMATAMPSLAICLVLVAMANIGLPLTNSFAGEFMMFLGIFHMESDYRVLYMVLAALAIILGAAYMLTMVQKTSFGSGRHTEATVEKLKTSEYICLTAISGIILIFGFYPQPMLDLTAGFAGWLAAHP